MLGKAQEYADRLAATGDEIKALQEANNQLKADIVDLKKRITKLEIDKEKLLLGELGKVNTFVSFVHSFSLIYFSTTS